MVKNLKNKTLSVVLATALFYSFMVFLSGCEKTTVDTQPLHLNVTLYDQDTITIQKYIEGKWNLVYAKGGLAYHIEYFDGYTAEFTADHQYITSGNGGTGTEMYYWRKEGEVYGYPDSVYVMFPREIVFDKIKNDTLIYSDVFVDGMYYYLTKINN